MIGLPYIALGSAAAILVSGAIGYGLGYDARDDRAKVEAAKIQNAMIEKEREMGAELSALSGKYEELRQQREAVREKTVNTIREVYRNVEVPAVCEPPRDAQRLLDLEVQFANAAASGKP